MYLKYPPKNFVNLAKIHIWETIVGQIQERLSVIYDARIIKSHISLYMYVLYIYI